MRNATGTFQYNLPLTAQAGTLDVGFSAITFFGAIMGFDDACPANNGYFLTSKYTHYIVHAMRELELGPMAFTPSLDALTGWLYFAGEFGVSNMNAQGLLLNGDTN